MAGCLSQVGAILRLKKNPKFWESECLKVWWIKSFKSQEVVATETAAPGNVCFMLRWLRRLFVAQKTKQNVIFRQFYRRIFLRSLGISRASGPPYGPINLRAQLSERELVAHDRACLQLLGRDGWVNLHTDSEGNIWSVYPQSWHQYQCHTNDILLHYSKL